MNGFGRRAAAAAFLAASLIAAPAQAQSDENLAQELTYCAGAVAAHGRLDVVNYPQGASGEWAPVLAAILSAMNRQEGVEGMTGRYAASAAKSFWLEDQSAAQREAAAQECRARFGSR